MLYRAIVVDLYAFYHFYRIYRYSWRVPAVVGTPLERHTSVQNVLKSQSEVCYDASSTNQKSSSRTRLDIFLSARLRVCGGITRPWCRCST
jgi:hypothetical protein